ncbi:MAG: hypothetical protein AAF989_02145 [Planctomycetota bacterium]
MNLRRRRLATLPVHWQLELGSCEPPFASTWFAMTLFAMTLFATT